MSNVFRISLLVLLLCGCDRPPLAHPKMISDAELNSMDLPFRLGQKVRVKSGPHINREGEIIEIDGFTGEVLFRVKFSDDQPYGVSGDFKEDAIEKKLNRVVPPEISSWLPLNTKKDGS